ncbi:unnamed protein product, partial [Aureobasidium uvarum]
MRAFLSFIIASLALSHHVEGRGLKPRQTSAATSTPPSSAVTNVTCNGKSAYNYSQMTSLHLLQLLDLFHKASVLYFLHCSFFELDFINHPMLDVFFEYQLLEIFKH